MSSLSDLADRSIACGKRAARAVRFFSLAVMVSGLIAGAARADGAITRLGLTFPDTVGGFTLDGIEDFEARQPGGGYAGTYVKDQVWADVYVYTDGRDNLPKRYDPAVSQAEYQSSAGAIDQAVSAGVYKSATAQGTVTLSNGGAPSFHCGRFVIVTKDQQNRDSLLCLTNRNGTFIKLRMSAPQGAFATTDTVEFVRFWLPGS